MNVFKKNISVQMMPPVIHYDDLIAPDADVVFAQALHLTRSREEVRVFFFVYECGEWSDESIEFAAGYLEDITTPEAQWNTVIELCLYYCEMKYSKRGHVPLKKVLKILNFLKGELNVR